MNFTYQPKEIEARAQAHWHATQAYRVTENAKNKHGEIKPKFYACSMLPYPSGKLHMGHVRNYTINDVMLRYLRMNGYNVLMPMGWDAFGMPAENAAIANNVPPAKWTYANIAEMKSQMQPLGLAFDWSRELATCNPDYYRWNQWLFLKMLEKGIAYRNTQVVNWDPVDQTVLANEQVIDGRGWRSGALVEKREIPGYYLAITAYAEELLDGAKNKLTGWPSQVRTMQENWIGKSTGVRFPFPHDIKDANGKLVQDGKLFVFTTRADTIMGVTFCAVAAEHPLAAVAAANNPALTAFIEECKHGGVAEAEMATAEKKGMATGLFVSHPLTKEKVEVWVGNYVLITYGDGAVMGVPAHDERDFAFAKKYHLPIKQVVDTGKPYSIDAWQSHYADDGKCIASGPLEGMDYDAAIDYVAAHTKPLGGEKKIQYRLRDWGISRQRYWGTPIPIIHCADCGPVPVPYADLPVKLPEDLVPDGSGNPLNKDERFLKCVCPKCSKPARRETDTMDTFIDSSWYYMRYCSPDAKLQMVDQRNDYWMPMDQYIGGIEHAVLHLLYARFWTKVMRDFGLVKFDEPFTNLFTQGMLLAECYYREDAEGKKRWYFPHEISVKHDERGRPIGATSIEDGEAVMLGGMEKMSKAKNNGVEPRDIIEKFGADTARAYVMFAGPPDQSAAWSDSGAEGVYRFLRRLYVYAQNERDALAQAPDKFTAANLTRELKSLRHAIHSILKQATHDYGRLQYNTVVSAAMKMLNALEDAKLPAEPSVHTVKREGMSILIRMLYPIAPHIGFQLWGDLGFEAVHGPIIDASWPKVDDAALEQDELQIVVQVNGKLRGHITVPASANKEAIEKLALADAGVAKHTEGKPIKKMIVVPGKLINVVV
jgi:leucyl-tRNA synthetase